MAHTARGLPLPPVSVPRRRGPHPYAPHPGPSSPQPPPAARRGPDSAVRSVLTGAFRHSPVRTLAVCLFSVASAGAAVALPAVLGHTLDLVLGARPGLHRALVLCAVLLVAEVLLDALVALTGGVLTARSTAWLRRSGIGHLLSLAPHRVADRFTPGDLVTRLTGNAADAGTAPTAAPPASPPSSPRSAPWSPWRSPTSGWPPCFSPGCRC